MTDKQLRYILAIAENGSITDTATKLFISQPSLSAMLSSVEKELGVQLFDRNSTPIVPTLAGEAYLNAAREMLGIMRNLELNIEQIKDSQSGRLSIYCGHQFSALLFPFLLPDFMAKYPKIQLHLSEISHSDVLNLRNSDDVDILFSDLNTDVPFFDREPILEEELVLFAPKSFEAELIRDAEHSRPCIDLSSAKAQPFVLMKQGSRLRGKVDNIFDDFGIKPNIILETANWETGLNMVRKGQACTILPLSPLAKVPTEDVQVLRIRGNYLRRTNMYWRNNSFNPKAIECFVEFTRSQMRNI